MNPVTKDNMNYTSAALGVIGVISLITWVTTGRKRFTGPIVDTHIHDIGNKSSEFAEKTADGSDFEGFK